MTKRVQRQKLYQSSLRHCKHLAAIDYEMQ